MPETPLSVDDRALPGRNQRRQALRHQSQVVLLGAKEKNIKRNDDFRQYGRIG